MQADGTAKTSTTASYCSWSSSSDSTMSAATAKRSTARPTCWRRSGRAQSTSFGPATPAFDRQRLGDQHPDGVGGQRHVVVADEHEGGVELGVEHRVGGLREARRVGCIEHRCRRQRCPHPGVDGRRTGGVDHQHRQPGVVLGGEALQRLLEPVAGLVGDHDREHGGCRVARRRRGLGIVEQQVRHLVALGRGRSGWYVGHDRGRLSPCTRRDGTPRTLVSTVLVRMVEARPRRP